MIRRPLRTLLLLTLGTASGITLFQPAPAAAATSAPEIQFYPAKTWTLETVGSQCAIRNVFNNGFAVAFTGAAQWVSSVNVNFRQAVFEEGQSYDVTVSVPGQVSHNFQAQAVNAETIDISIRSRKEIYKTIRSAGVFDLNVEGNDFRFYLTGFPAAAPGFESCIAQSGKSAAPAPVSAQNDPAPALAPAPVSSAVNNNQVPMPLVASSHNLREQKDTDIYVRHEAMSLEEDFKSETLNATQTGRKRMSETLAAEIQQNPEMISMDEPALPESVRRHQQLSSAPTPPPKEEEPLVTELAVPSVPIEVVEVNESVKDATESLAPVAPLDLPPALPSALADEAPAKSAPVKAPATADPVMPLPPVAASAPVKESPSERIKTPPVKVTRESLSAEADFRNLPPPAGSPASDGGYEDRAALMAMISTLKDKVDALQGENLALNEELHSSLEASEQERMSIASENWNLERATMQYNEAERQLKRLGQQLQAERARCKVEKKELETMLFDPQLTEDTQLARLARLEADLMEARAEIARLRKMQ